MAIQEGLAQARHSEAAQIRVQLCAKGLRAQAELAALARDRRDADALRDRLGRARKLLTVARRAAAEASAITPNADGWRALAEAEYERARGKSRPGTWSEAAATWERLERSPLAAYCRWRQAEALVAAGASRVEASVPLREAHVLATRIGAKPLTQELERLAERARLDLGSPDAGSAERKPDAEDILGLTAREAEVLSARRPRLHQPRDRGDARHQRQDGRRPRLQHPPQARRAQPARGGRHRAPPVPLTAASGRVPVRGAPAADDTRTSAQRPPDACSRRRAGVSVETSPRAT